MPTPSRVLTALRARAPASAAGWVRLVVGGLSVLVVLGMIGFVLGPLLGHPYGHGRDAWESAESERQLVVEALRRFHAMPMWDPYTGGGHAAWGSLDGGTTLVAPWLPAYLMLPMPVAIRVEAVGSALLGAAGAWALASRSTRSWPARAFVAVVFAVNGRWTLQLAAGETAQLAYAWMPWALFFYDRAVAARRAPGRPWGTGPSNRAPLWAGGCLAMMLYAGGVDALVQTATVLVGFAVLEAIGERSARPLVAVALTSAIAVGLSAPKLLPVFDELRRAPPPPEAGGALGPPQLLQLLTNREQGFAIGHAGIADGAWHDVGMYLGWLVLLLLAAGLVAGRGSRAWPYAVLAAACVVLGLGAFSTAAPWVLLHRLPLFDREHVAARWLYPAALLFACAAVAAFERAAHRIGRWRTPLEVGALITVAWVASDVGAVARYPLMNHLAERDPPKLQTASGYAASAHVVDGAGGAATFSAWSPSGFDLHVEGAPVGSMVVVDQGYDPGWSVDDRPALERSGEIAARVTSAAQTFRFRYRAGGLVAGLGIFVLTVAVLAFIERERARRRLRAAPSAPA
jgi:hypothetical protein